WPLLWKSVAVSLGALVGFVVGFPTHLVALAAGAVLLLTRRLRPERIYADIDWTMLLMFGGLFVVVRGLEATGLQEAALRTIDPSRLGHPLVLAGVTVALSNLVSNVPAVLLFRPLLPRLGPPHAPGLLLASPSTPARRPAAFRDGRVTRRTRSPPAARPRRVLGLLGDAGDGRRASRHEPPEEPRGSRRSEKLRHDEARHVGGTDAREGVGQRAGHGDGGVRGSTGPVQSRELTTGVHGATARPCQATARTAHSAMPRTAS